MGKKKATKKPRKKRTAKPEPAPEQQPAAAPPLEPNMLPDCPEYLDATARAERGNQCDSLASVGLLHEADRSLMEIYCQTFSAWRTACEMVARYGAVMQVKIGSATVPKRNPFDVIRESSATICARLLRDFGLTPTSKGREDLETNDDETIEEKRTKILRRLGIVG